MMGTFRIVIGAVVGIVAASAFPAHVFGETVVFTYETFDWSSGRLNPPYVQLPFDIGRSVDAVEDVRVRYGGISHDGTGYCCQGGVCADLDCEVQLIVEFAGVDSIGSVVDLPGEGVEHVGVFEFFVYRWSYPYWPYWTISPLPDNPWSFLEPGAGMLYITSSGATDCNTKCSAYIDLTSVTIEIDYAAQVPATQSSWGTLKASYR